MQYYDASCDHVDTRFVGAKQRSDPIQGHYTFVFNTRSLHILNHTRHILDCPYKEEFLANHIPS